MTVVNDLQYEVLWIMKQSMIISWLSPCNDTVYGKVISVHTHLDAMWRFWWQKHKAKSKVYRNGHFCCCWWTQNI